MVLETGQWLHREYPVLGADASTDTSADASTDASTNACAYAGSVRLQ
jgi:hypothetical protein